MSDWRDHIVAASLALYLRFTYATTRWELDGEETLAAIEAAPAAIVAFWHERLPLMAALWRISRKRGLALPGVVLTSRHRDGRLIGAIMRRFGIDAVHGSTASRGRDRGGAASLRALLRRLAAGAVVILTPDGPRGPPRVAAPGLAALAGLSGRAIFPTGAATSLGLRLPTWDRMIVPLPFGRGVLVCAAPILIPREGSDAATTEIAAAIDAATARADALCRR